MPLASLSQTVPPNVDLPYELEDFPVKKPMQTFIFGWLLEYQSLRKPPSEAGPRNPTAQSSEGDRQDLATSTELGGTVCVPTLPRSLHSATKRTLGL